MEEEEDNNFSLGSTDFEFSSRYSDVEALPFATSLTMSTADELFQNGHIRPLLRPDSLSDTHVIFNASQDYPINEGKEERFTLSVFIDEGFEESVRRSRGGGMTRDEATKMKGVMPRTHRRGGGGGGGRGSEGLSYSHHKSLILPILRRRGRRRKSPPSSMLTWRPPCLEWVGGMGSCSRGYKIGNGSSSSRGYHTCHIRGGSKSCVVGGSNWGCDTCDIRGGSKGCEVGSTRGGHEVIGDNGSQGCEPSGLKGYEKRNDSSRDFEANNNTRGGISRVGHEVGNGSQGCEASGSMGYEIGNDSSRVGSRDFEANNKTRGGISRGGEVGNGSRGCEAYYTDIRGGSRDCQVGSRGGDVGGNRVNEIGNGRRSCEVDGTSRGNEVGKLYNRSCEVGNGSTCSSSSSRDCKVGSRGGDVDVGGNRTCEVDGSRGDVICSDSRGCKVGGSRICKVGNDIRGGDMDCEVGSWGTGKVDGSRGNEICNNSRGCEVGGSRGGDVGGNRGGEVGNDSKGCKVDGSRGNEICNDSRGYEVGGSRGCKVGGRRSYQIVGSCRGCEVGGKRGYEVLGHNCVSCNRVKEILHMKERLHRTMPNTNTNTTTTSSSSSSSRRSEAGTTLAMSPLCYSSGNPSHARRRSPLSLRQSLLGCLGSSIYPSFLPPN